MAARLRQLRRRRLYADTLMQVLVDLRPELATSPSRAQRLAELVTRLGGDGVVVPSRGTRSWFGVSLPAFVDVEPDGQGGRRAGGGATEEALRFPWVPELSWVPSSTRGRRLVELQRLQQISRWISTNRARVPVPVRERSLEIFGDDKRLGPMLDGVLRSHVETVKALAVLRIYPPMAVEQVEGAAGRRVLVVENGTTFWSALEALRRHVAAGEQVRYSHVGYGAGSQLEAIVPSLERLRSEGIEYFGDLDRDGLRFAAAGARSCNDAGLGTLQPAPELYEMLLEHGQVQAKEGTAGRKEARPWPAQGMAWLGEDLATRLEKVLGPGEWLAQEWVGLELLVATPTWCN